MSTATDELITAYLAELEREAARLPWNARSELLEDVRSHIEVALAEIRAADAGGTRGGLQADVPGLDADRQAAGAGVEAARVADVPSREADVTGVEADRQAAGTGVEANREADVPGAEGDRPAGPRLGDAEPHLAEAADISSSGPSAAPSSAAADEVSHVRAMLAALGEPSEIVAAALADNPEPPEPAYPTPELHPTRDLYAGGATSYRTPTRNSPPYPLDTADIGAVALLLLGGFLAGIGWVIGAVLLWTSTRWTRTEKLIGTLILPGGIAGGLLAFTTGKAGTRSACSADHCVTIHDGWNPPGWLAAVTIALILLAPAATAVFLVNRARLRPGVAPASRTGLAIIAGVGTVGLLAAAGLLVATSTSGVRSGGPTPAPVDYSGGPASGYVVPVSSPAQVVSSS